MNNDPLTAATAAVTFDAEQPDEATAATESTESTESTELAELAELAETRAPFPRTLVGLLVAGMLVVLAVNVPRVFASTFDPYEPDPVAVQQVRAQQSAPSMPAQPAPIEPPVTEQPNEEPALLTPAEPQPEPPSPEPSPTEPLRPPAGVAPSQEWLARVSAATEIPQRALYAYAVADLAVAIEQPNCGLGWNTLAGIGRIESNHGRHGGGELQDDGFTSQQIRGPALDGNGVAEIRDTDGGVWDGDTTWDRAVGPMQFIPSTWARWGADGNGDGEADPNQIDDAALAAARYLCASGPMTSADGWRTAVLSYNHSRAYANDVADAANDYARVAG